MSEISIDEYVENRIEELKRFRENWKKRADKEPDDWPLLMQDGEWFEQETCSYDLGFMEPEQ